MNGSSHIVIVGASLGGLRAAEAIKTLDADARITVVGKEKFGPYNRPPLSKAALTHAEDSNPDDGGKEDFESLRFKIGPKLKDIEWRLGTHAERLDASVRELHLSDGSTLAYDGLVAATGLRSRHLSFPASSATRYSVRTLEDAVTLRARLKSRPRVCIIGAGFIGCEIAASAITLGCAVTVIEPFGEPMQQALGTNLGAFMRNLHESRDVRFLFKDPTIDHREDQTPEGTVQVLTLASGSVVSCDVVIEAVGSHPNVEWLDGNGFDLEDGLLVDEGMAADATGRVVAVGDIARFPNALFDAAPRRVEHWCIPSLTAKRAARTLLNAINGVTDEGGPFRPLPSFWSDQYNLRIQSFGMPGLADNYRLLAGTLQTDVIAPDTAPVVGAYRDDALIGVIGVGCETAKLLPYRTMIGTPS